MTLLRNQFWQYFGKISPLTLVWLISLLTVTGVVFGLETGKAIAHYRFFLTYLPFAVVIWGTLQLGQRGAVLGTLIVSGTAIWGTVLGRGPFITKASDLSEAILLLQFFLGFVAVTALVLGAIVTERNLALESLRASEAKHHTINQELENRVDEQLKVSQQRLALLIQQTPLAVIEWNLNMEIVEWNPAAQTIFGYSKAEVLGKTAEFLVPENAIAQVNQVRDDLLSGKGGTRSCNENLTKEGRTIICEWYNMPLIDAQGKLLGAASMALDITERQKSQDALRESEERFALAIQANDNGLFDINLKTKECYYSPQYLNLLGYSLDMEGPALSEFSALFHPDDVEAVQAIWDDILAGRLSQWELEFRMFHTNGSILWILSQGLVIRDDKGEVVRLVGTHTDISDAVAAATRRKQAEAALRSSEERFRQLAENIHEVFWMSSLDPLEIIYVSPGYEKIWGRSCENLYHEPSAWLDAIHPLDRDRVFAALTKKSQEDYDEEYRIVRPDKSIRWIRDRVFPIRDEQGRVYRFAGIAEDITERKQAEAELHRQTLQRQLFAEITLKIRQSLQLEEILKTTATEVQRILQVDRVLIYQIMPDRTGSVVTETVVPGWPSILGQNLNCPCIEPNYFQHYRQGKIRAIDNLQQTQIETCYVEKLKQFGVKANLVVPILQRESLWGLLIVHQCTTPRQWQNFETELLRQLADQVGIALAQSQLLEQETKTTQQLAEQNLHLEQARQEAETANRAKSEFLANMSHELRTPLNGILGYTQILKQESSLSPKQQHDLDIIQRCGEHLLTLLNDILDLSKIEARKTELNLSNFQFPHFLESLVEIVRIFAQQKNISFEFQLLSELPCMVRGDERRLRQVLINLLGNAVKFTDQGRVTLKVGYVSGTEDWRLVRQLGAGNTPNPSSESSTRKMRFVVEDTGIGIGSEQLTEIFLPFHQIDTPSRRVEGTGLGLGISQRLVQLMGGKLQVESTLGQGSIFCLELDLPEGLECQETPETMAKAIISFQGHKRKVLVADDQGENRSILVDLLSPLGFEVVEATDGQDCLNQALKIKPDVILLDPVMSGINGLEVTRQLRQLPELKDIVILATSARVFDDNQQECLAAGCNGFIPQPVQIENLFEQLQVHLNLEWIYRQERGSFSSLTRCPTDVVANPLSLVAPPQSEIMALYELAMMGDIKGIREQANKLEQLDNKFVPFAQQLFQLAQSFQEKQILEFVKKYRE